MMISGSKQSVDKRVYNTYPGDFDPGFAGYAAFTILKFFIIEVLYQICAKQF